MDAPIPPIPLPLAAIKTLRPPPPHRPVTVDHVQSNSVARKPVAKTPPELSPDLPVRVPSGSPDHGYDNPAAQERSMHDPHLKRLRWSQLDEQRRFNRFEADQRRVMRSRQAQRERRVLDQYPHKVEAAKSRHVDALASLEQRHLSAEVDLEKTLAIERRACETRIKHMEAYCNPRSTVRGMPSRTVTKQHHQQLEQQYRVWSGMDNLHAAKINVLREKQGKQVERVMGKQEAELKDMEQDLANDMQQLEVSRQSDEGLLRREFSARRKRLTSRWSLAEAIERKKLENETRETYAPLPPIEWKDPQQGTTEEEEESFDTELARDVRMAHDATSFNMI